MAKRTILIVDDMEVNRLILAKILSDDYTILQAANGQQALELLEDKADDISVVLLDIIMPVLDGYDVLISMRKDSVLSKIPVIVTSGQNSDDAETKALILGANDYILKPYKTEIIKQRIANTISLRETAALVNSVRKDSMTDAYSKEYFFIRAAEIIRLNINETYQIICCDIERFKLINELYGIQTGNNLLKHLCLTLVKFLGENSIVGRIGSDIFACLVPKEYTFGNSFFDKIISEVNTFNLNLNIVLRFGIYDIEDIQAPVNIMCDRAILAIQSIKGRYDTYIASYDDTARTKLLNEQFIVSSMKTSLEQGHFKVYFQPKYDLKTENIVGAEALVRWIHPQKGFMSPGEFIPLFEKNGFITDLDLYIWEQCCQKIRAWIDAGNKAIPLSVNVSRADIYNPNLDDILISMIKRYRLSPAYLHLEITETAYTQNPEQLIDMVKRLKRLGFVIEMDDFGTGYSSLNMISELPIDILKLDMKFIQSEEKKNNSRSILSFIIGLAKWLDLSVIAEGVETLAQVNLLKSLNCECAQGFYYARPLPQNDFEDLLKKTVVHAITKRAPSNAKTGADSLKTMVVFDYKGDDYNELNGFFFDDYNVVHTKSQDETITAINNLCQKISILIIAFEKDNAIIYLEKICTLCRAYGIPVITLNNDIFSVDTALSAGIADYALRPYSAAALKNRIEHVIASSQIALFEKERELNATILEMKKRAEEDSLTGLLNQVEFKMRVNDFFTDNKSSSGIFLLIDPDDFKLINNTLGRETGDRILCAIAEMLTRLFPETKNLCRSANEFSIFIPFMMEEIEMRAKIAKISQGYSYNLNAKK